MNRIAHCILCGRRAVHMHHACYSQWIPPESRQDTRNLVPTCFRCHERHHTRTCVFSLGLLPDSVFEFAVEVLGAGPAYERLRRTYRGEDRRLQALLGKEAV